MAWKEARLYNNDLIFDYFNILNDIQFLFLISISIVSIM